MGEMAESLRDKNIQEALYYLENDRYSEALRSIAKAPDCALSLAEVGTAERYRQNVANWHASRVLLRALFVLIGFKNDARI
jgi:hypothetical protein